MAWLWVLLVGCAPPPLDGAGLPSIGFVFPQSQTDVVVCPTIAVAVDVDNWAVVPPGDDQAAEEDARIGHWHLRYAGGDHIATGTEEWVAIHLDEVGAEPTLVALTARLANHDHNELNTAVYPDAEATVEFLVGDTGDCVGRAPEDDTGR